MNKKKCGNLLHSDAIIILITIFISIICEIFFETSSNYDYLVLIVLNIIAICYGKTPKKRGLWIIMIVLSLILIIESVIQFSSLFNLIFTLLGIFTIIHSIGFFKENGGNYAKRK